jgi:8-oxo-dGTP pyrophosphatase MutT (NUDIX family)
MMHPPGDDTSHPISTRKIRIAAAIIMDAQGLMLLVRKHGTQAFIQPGGKIEPGEMPEDALRRELKEELHCVPTRMKFCGHFLAPAVNEPGHLVEALIYHADIHGQLKPAAEIAEIAWINPAHPGDRILAPLTRDYVLPLTLANQATKIV